MVAIVGPAGKRWEADRHEGLDLNTFAPHALKEPGRHIPASYVVIYNTHFHSLVRLSHKGISYEPSKRVVLEYIYINVDMTGGTGNVAK